MIRAARLRLTAWYAAIVLAILLVLGVAAYASMRRTLLAAIDRDVRAVVESATAGAADTLSREPRSGRRDDDDHESDDDRRAQREYADTFVAVLASDGRVVSSPPWLDARELADEHLADRALDGRSELRTVEVDDEPFRAYAVPVRHDGRVVGAVVGGISLGAYERDLRLLLIVLVATGAGGVVLAVAGGYVFAGRALEPIRVAYERQRRFVGDASHELRSPLAVMRASADLLLRDQLAPEQRESAEEIRDTAVEASVLVDDLLALARLDAEGTARGDEVTDLAPAVTRVLDQLRLLLAEHGSAPSADLRPAPARCPEAAVQRITRALLENVIAHTPAGTAVEVTTTVEGDTAVLRVRDHGPGVPAAALPTILDRFTRVDTARTPGTGSGLGLAIVAALARRFRGTVSATNAPGGGLQVEVRLPAA
ncbi:MAG: sensor histidine kinase [Dehalococcoidia bacterium]